MDKLVFSCFLLGSLTPDPGPTDSCALNAYCATGLTNVGCNPPPITGGSACDGKSPQVIELNEPEQFIILQIFNGNRNSYASGMMGNDPANRMFMLQWDANLATQAGHNVRSCTVARDACRNTAGYANVGQLISGSLYGGPHLAFRHPSNKIAHLAISNLHIFYYLDVTGSFSSYSAATGTENEANILNERSKKVGCALIQWTEVDEPYIYLVCNFSANVIEGQPVFTTAAKAGKGCKTKDTIFSALCLT